MSLTDLTRPVDPTLWWSRVTHHEEEGRWSWAVGYHTRRLIGGDAGSWAEAAGKVKRFKKAFRS